MTQFLTTMLYHGLLLMVVREFVLPIASHQVNDGNYIVPRTTIELSGSSNASGGGHKKICQTNLDCEMYTNNQCCLTISGFSKCRKRCKPKNKLRKFRPGKGKMRKNKYKNSHKIKKVFSDVGCVVSSDEVYKEGELLEAKDGCNECQCISGELICTQRSCTPGRCWYKNKLYDEGYQLSLHYGCKRCICKHQNWNCTVYPCSKSTEELKKAQNSTGAVVTTMIVMTMFVTITYILVP